MMSPTDLTERQRELYLFIRARSAAGESAPTVREIAKHLGITSTNGVNDHLLALERKGFITRDSLKARSIRITGRVADDPGAPRVASPSNPRLLFPGYLEGVIEQVIADNRAGKPDSERKILDVYARLTRLCARLATELTIR